MKKFYLLAALAATLTLPVLAQEVLQEGYWHYTIEGGKATVVKFTPPPRGEDEWEDPNAQVPDSLGGCPVVAIGDECCKGVDLSGISLPKTVEMIGNKAFYGTNNVYSNINLRYVKFIGDSAFYQCGSPAFYFNNPQNYANIGRAAFTGYDTYNETYYGIGTIYIPKGTYDAFVERFGQTPQDPLYDQLNNDWGFEEVAFVGDVIYSRYVFEEWDEDGNYTETEGWILFNGLLAEGHVTMPNEIDGEPVIGIGHMAFRNMSGGHAGENPRLTGITINDNSIFIEMAAFLGCYNLKSIDLKNVREIKYAAFCNCWGLEDIHFRLTAYETTLGPLLFNPITDEGGFDETSVIPATVYVPKGTRGGWVVRYAQEPADDWFGEQNNLYYFWKDGRLLEEGDTPEPPAKPGDVSGDGKVDVDDINQLVSMLLGKVDTTDAADVNGDGKVDVDDINMVINIMLGK